MRTVDIASDLIRFDSVSSHSNIKPSQYVADFLSRQGFEIEWMTFRDAAGIEKANVVAKRNPTKSISDSSNAAGSDQLTHNDLVVQRKDCNEPTGGIAYMAHTDVVPADDWNTGFNGPFEPILKDDRLYGRGSCDMKGSLACALAAIESIERGEQTKPIYFVVTADEEVGMQGAKLVAAQSKIFAEMVQRDAVGIIGEPTLLDVVYAHKGGASVRVVAHGVSAHSSMRGGINANLQLIPILPLLVEIQKRCESDLTLQNQEFDPPTLSWNIVLRNEPYAINITPSVAEALIFFRTMPNVDHLPLVKQIEEESTRLGLNAHYNAGGPPMNVPPDSQWVSMMLELVGKSKPTTVCYSTDACALKQLRKLMICGPGSIHQAHRNDEFIELTQLQQGVTTYTKAFRYFG